MAVHRILRCMDAYLSKSLPRAVIKFLASGFEVVCLKWAVSLLSWLNLGNVSLILEAFGMLSCILVVGLADLFLGSLVVLS